MLGAAKEAGLARPLLEVAGEKQNQVLFDFEDQSVMLKEENVPGAKVQYPM